MPQVVLSKAHMSQPSTPTRGTPVRPSLGDADEGIIVVGGLATGLSAGLATPADASGTTSASRSRSGSTAGVVSATTFLQYQRGFMHGGGLILLEVGSTAGFACIKMHVGMLSLSAACAYCIEQRIAVEIWVVVFKKYP